MLRLLLLVCIAGTMFAAQITGLPNTGTGSWTVGSSPHGAFTPVVVTGWPIPTYWMANNSTSSWISRLSDYANAGDSPGEYRFDLSFNVDPSSAVGAWFLFRMAADNTINRVEFNGSQLQGVSHSGYSAFSPFFTVASGIQTANLLSIYVTNGGLSSISNPVGLRVEFSDPVDTPEPGTFTILGGSLCALAVALRLRR